MNSLRRLVLRRRTARTMMCAAPAAYRLQSDPQVVDSRQQVFEPTHIKASRKEATSILMRETIARPKQSAGHLIEIRSSVLRSLRMLGKVARVDCRTLDFSITVK